MSGLDKVERSSFDLKTINPNECESYSFADGQSHLDFCKSLADLAPSAFFGIPGRHSSDHDTNEESIQLELIENPTIPSDSTTFPLWLTIPLSLFDLLINSGTVPE
jgi:hypothetical protein